MSISGEPQLSSLLAVNYLQAHRARGAGETSGSFITFLTKEALLSSGPGLSISSLQGQGLLSPGQTWSHTNTIPPPPAHAGQQQCQAGITSVLPRRLFWGKKVISVNREQYSQLDQADQLGLGDQWGLGDPATKKEMSVRSRVTNSPGKGEFLQYNLH